LQSFDELLEFIEIWGFVISLATCQPGNTSEDRSVAYSAELVLLNKHQIYGGAPKVN